MQLTQLQWLKQSGWNVADGTPSSLPQLVLVFGGGSALRETDALAKLRMLYPPALFFGCSTAGEIRGTEVGDDTIVATAVEFKHATLRSAHAEIRQSTDSFTVGQSLAAAIPHDGLRHAFVLSDGLLVNGSELVRGLTASLPASVSVTGGLSGDGARFQTTYVIRGDHADSGVVGILGFYGVGLTVGYGSLGGWEPFGPERIITRSSGNVLYGLDGQPALALYRQYLGEYATGLPATGLLFPLSLRVSEDAIPVVRTILAINDKEGSLTFAGDMPEGAHARLMKANFERLVVGAMDAARSSQEGVPEHQPELAILISCVGRKLVLKQRVEEEVEGVRQVLGPKPVLTGFYSYGEISPFALNTQCELHNQTMTITTLAEAA